MRGLEAGSSEIGGLGAGSSEMGGLAGSSEIGGLGAGSSEMGGLAGSSTKTVLLWAAPQKGQPAVVELPPLHHPMPPLARSSSSASSSYCQRHHTLV